MIRLPFHAAEFRVNVGKDSLSNLRGAVAKRAFMAAPGLDGTRLWNVCGDFSRVHDRYANGNVRLTRQPKFFSEI